ncbi:hypothetical protein D029_3081B, partial [Vibrio parahaemolyticus 970107]
DVTNTFRFTLF